MPYPQRGEIYLVKLPGHPADPKARPALVVSMDVRNRLANDVIVVPLSTTFTDRKLNMSRRGSQGG